VTKEQQINVFLVSAGLLLSQGSLHASSTTVTNVIPCFMTYVDIYEAYLGVTLKTHPHLVPRS